MSDTLLSGLGISSALQQKTLVNLAMDLGGDVYPLVLPLGVLRNRAVFNPSIAVTSKGEILLNARVADYYLYLERGNRFPSPWGSATSLWHDHSGNKVTTENYIIKLNNELQMETLSQVDTSAIDKEPEFNVVGLEDGRLVEWNQRIYLVGSRRDANLAGKVRVEISEIIIDQLSGKVKEVSRNPIPSPEGEDFYCEKNWMPVVSRPFHFVRWSNPTNLLVTSENGVIIDNETRNATGKQESSLQISGGTQIIAWGNYLIAITHIKRHLRNNRTKKTGLHYKHLITVWDDSLNYLGSSPVPFSFLAETVEYAVGLARRGQDALISFGLIDGAAMILRVPSILIDALIQEIVKT